MKNYQKIITSSQISRNTANNIAESQFDLGGTSKKDMIIALSGLKKHNDESLNKRKRIEAFERLDEISQFIVYQILDSDVVEERYIVDHLNYIIKGFSLESKLS